MAIVRREQLMVGGVERRLLLVQVDQAVDGVLVDLGLGFSGTQADEVRDALAGGRGRQLDNPGWWLGKYENRAMGVYPGLPAPEAAAVGPAPLTPAPAAPDSLTPPAEDGTLSAGPQTEDPSEPEGSSLT